MNRTASSLQEKFQTTGSPLHLVRRPQQPLCGLRAWGSLKLNQVLESRPSQVQPLLQLRPLHSGRSIGGMTTLIVLFKIKEFIAWGAYRYRIRSNGFDTRSKSTIFRYSVFLMPITSSPPQIGAQRHWFSLLRCLAFHQLQQSIHVII